MAEALDAAFRHGCSFRFRTTPCGEICGRQSGSGIRDFSPSTVRIIPVLHFNTVMIRKSCRSLRIFRAVPFRSVGKKSAFTLFTFKGLNYVIKQIVFYICNCFK